VYVCMHVYVKVWVCGFLDAIQERIDMYYAITHTHLHTRTTQEYTKLKNLLARQPGPEVAEQLSVYQTSIKEKEHQVRVCVCVCVCACLCGMLY
jgi:hypothetical protein